MNALRSFAIVALLLISLAGESQNLTGTWLAAYYRDQPGNKRIFYYRIYLRHSEDSVYGICEALDAKTDMNGINPEKAEAVSCSRVYNYDLCDNADTTQLILTTGRHLNSGKDILSAAPFFSIFNCRKLWGNHDFFIKTPQIIYSPMPASDDPEGKMTIKKISDEIPAWRDIDDTTANNLSLHIKSLNIGGLFKKKQRAERLLQPAQQSLLAGGERVDKIQRVIEVDSAFASIELFDNGIVDNDTVSFFLNDQLLLSKKKVTATPIRMQVTLDNSRENRLTLLAHNEGTIPPNTAMLLIKAGTVQYNISLTSSLSQNAVVLVILKRNRNNVTETGR